MASISETFDGFVGEELSSFTNLPAPWPAVRADQASLRHVSQHAASRPLADAIGRNRHPTPLDTADMIARVQYVVVGSNEYFGVAVRMNDTNGDHYNIVCNGTDIGVEKYTEAGGYDEDFSVYISRTVSNGDYLSLAVSGTDPVLLYVEHNDVLVTSFGVDGIISDSAPNRIVSGNYAGLFCYNETGDQIARLKNFSAQDLGGPSISPLILLGPARNGGFIDLTGGMS